MDMQHVGRVSSKSASPVQAVPVNFACAARRVFRQLAVAIGLVGAGLVCVSARPLQAGPARLAAAGETPPARPSAASGEASECLTVTRSSSATYVIENRSCPEESVLTAIELADEGDLARCFTKKIRTQISLASTGAVPLINYQCIEGTPGCSFEVLRSMFPECHSG
jgi:hypothetical protein